MQNLELWSLKQEQVDECCYHLAKQEDRTETSLLPKKSKDGRKFLIGGWSRQEQLAYFKFIKEHVSILRIPKLRKKCRIFRQMSQVIVTRGTAQCKSHHQKMIMSHGKSLQRLINFSESFSSSDRSFLVLKDFKQIKLTNTFYRIWARGPQMRILIDEDCIQTY